MKEENSVELLQRLRTECELNQGKETEGRNEKKFPKIKLVCFLLSAICLVLLICCVKQYRKIETMGKSIEWLQMRVNNFQERVNYYKSIAENSIEQETSGGKIVKSGTPEYVFITKTGECYHRIGCKYVSDNATMIYILDAIAEGYKPCSYCLK